MAKKKANTLESRIASVLEDKNCIRLEDLTYEGIDNDEWYPKMEEIDKVIQRIEDGGDSEDIEFLYWILNHFYASTSEEKETESRIRDFLGL